MDSVYARSAVRSLRLGLAGLALLLGAYRIAQLIRPYDMGPLLALLFLGYPLLALALGAAADRWAVPLWMAALTSVLLFTVLFLGWFNATALVYVPFYALATAVGYGLARLLNRR